MIKITSEEVDKYRKMHNCDINTAIREIENKNMLEAIKKLDVEDSLIDILSILIKRPQ